MVYKKYPRRYKRRYGRYRRKRQNRTVNRTNTMTGIPDTNKIKLSYLANVTHSADVFNVKIIRANSLHDPDYSLGGGQPTGFDQWASFYDRYKVTSSKCSVQVINQSADPVTGSVICSVFPVIDPASASSNANKTQTQAYQRTKILTPSNAQGFVQINNFISTKKIYGDKTINDIDYSAPITADPFKSWHWAITTQTSDFLSFHSVILRIKVTFWAELYERKYLPQS